MASEAVRVEGADIDRGLRALADGNRRAILEAVREGKDTAPAN